MPVARYGDSTIGCLSLTKTPIIVIIGANVLRGSPVDRTDWKGYILPVCTENLIRIDQPKESPNLSAA